VGLGWKIRRVKRNARASAAQRGKKREPLSGEIKGTGLSWLAR